MRILVQKYGGTSLSTIESRKYVISHIQAALAQEYKVVVVVSAMGRKGDPYSTDTLIDLIRQNGNSLPAREKDLLLSCGEIISAAVLCSMLRDQEIPATVLTGAQAGIITNEQYGNAQIQSIHTDRINRLLEQDQVVIVTGFQGMTLQQEYTTLGRGGSDTTATAIGGALQAEFVDIFTDVDGVLTADPQIVNDAQPLAHISFAEICNMAYCGAKVIHPRAVEVAMQSRIPIRIRSTFKEGPGTLVDHRSGHSSSIKDRIQDRTVTAIAHVADMTQIRVSMMEGIMDLQLSVFKAMANQQISVDCINVSPAAVTFSVSNQDADRAAQSLYELGYEPECLSDCAIVSVIGGGMNGTPGVMAEIVEALTMDDIPILQTADSYTTIWILVRTEHMARAIRALHNKFDLHHKLTSFGSVS